ncbi:MAG: mechanosensitive ion channel family protein, partial [Proteobacteria bacterium]|nr:mechanosensitive ion channel family protein [Pseudomonadota bacterium]
AIQGPLSNYGAGLTIILTRPFVVGNTITVAGVSGVVEEVKLACTILTNEDGVKITIPNKHIVGEVLHNSRENKIVESVIGISYDSDPEKAVEQVRQILEKFEEVQQTPRPQVGIQEFADSSINIGYRYWVPTAKYFQVSYEVNSAVYKALQEAGINIPFPQRDVHIISQPGQT